MKLLCDMMYRERQKAKRKANRGNAILKRQKHVREGDVRHRKGDIKRKKWK